VVDLNSAMDSFPWAVLVFVIFCAKEEGYLLETSTDDRCFFMVSFEEEFIKILTGTHVASGKPST